MKTASVYLSLFLVLFLSSGSGEFGHKTASCCFEPAFASSQHNAAVAAQTVGSAGGDDSQAEDFESFTAGPESLEKLYRAVWLKVSREYHDSLKLRDWAEWENKYSGKLKSEEDLDAALSQMLGSLQDRWTIYYSPAEIEEQKQAEKDGVLSIGMILRKHADNAWHIDGMQFNSPAMLSVLREGDIVKSINGTDLSTLSQTEVSRLLRGKAAEKLSLLAVYDGGEHSVELAFAPQGPDLVNSVLLPGGILYVRLPTFISEETVQSFVEALAKGYQSSEGSLNGLVIDLRYNGGGLVNMALAVSSLFLEHGTVTITTTRSDRNLTETHYKVVSTPDYLQARMPRPLSEFQRFLSTVPVVLLTNGSTASASEITTGALKDNGRAFVIGVKTFGKAVGYTDTLMPNGGVLQVTNLSYLTPGGKNIADRGIEPDLKVEQPRGKAIVSETDEQLKAAHEHLLAVARQRSRQLEDAQELSKQRQLNTQQKRESPAAPLFLLLASVGAASVLLFTVFLLSRRKRIY